MILVISRVGSINLFHLFVVLVLEDAFVFSFWGSADLVVLSSSQGDGKQKSGSGKLHFGISILEEDRSMNFMR